MKRSIFIIPVLSMSLLFGAYSVGETVSITDQNRVFDICNGTNPLNGDTDDFKLADLNGDLNGGQYFVLQIDMAASW